MFDEFIKDKKHILKKIENPFIKFKLIESAYFPFVSAGENDKDNKIMKACMEFFWDLCQGKTSISHEEFIEELEYCENIFRQINAEEFVLMAETSKKMASTLLEDA